MATIEGTCHCGEAGWSITGDPGSVTACNCTVCRRYGALWAYDYENERFSTHGQTRSYIRGRTTEFHFCEGCGCIVWWRARSPDAEGRTRLAVNMRMAEPADVAALPIDHFDGLDTFEDLPASGKQVRDYWA